MKKTYPASIFIITLILSGCVSASDHRQAVQDNTANSLTVGTVQRQVSIGMSSAQVAEVLGSPNVVTTDEQRREVWVYDKIATEAAYSTSGVGLGGGAGAGGTPGSTLILGGLGGSWGKNAGAASTTQKTLTVIIKFDNEGKVRDFAYHSSKF
ncbi:MAG: SmpA / OmlA family protein [Candidatus Omnitrophica bacterium ADurb.Bin277]|nr:MAG: SmpA / OmlA family protein [Candidatus Omnitrophica bacterium ADurb.Bin277]